MSLQGRVFGVEFPLVEMAPLCTLYKISLEEVAQRLFLSSFNLFGKKVYWTDGLTKEEIAVSNELGFREFGSLTFFPIHSHKRTGLSVDYDAGIFWFNNPGAAVLCRIGRRFRISPVSLAEDLMRFALHVTSANLSAPFPSGYYFTSAWNNSHRIDLIGIVS